jgi:hypothetical protein
MLDAGYGAAAVMSAPARNLATTAASRSACRYVPIRGRHG